VAIESAVSAAKRYLNALEQIGFRVSFGVIFGSGAAGQTNDWSDIDLLVVSSRFDGVLNRRDIDTLWRTAAHLDSRIEPVPCGERQWMEDRTSAAIEIARREGQVVSFTEAA